MSDEKERPLSAEDKAARKAAQDARKDERKAAQDAAADERVATREARAAERNERLDKAQDELIDDDQPHPDQTLPGDLGR